MSTRIAAPPLERDYLRRAWLVMVGIVVAAAAVIAMALTAPGSSPSGSTPGVERIVDGGSGGPHAPIRIGDFVCGQCR